MKYSYTKSFLVITLAFLLGFGNIACFKPKPQDGETPNDFRNREVAISLAQIATFLDGSSEAVILLQQNNVAGNNFARKFIETQDKVIEIWSIVKGSLERGIIDQSTRDKVKEIVEVVKQLNDKGIIPPNDPDIKKQFASFLDNLVTFAESLYNLVKNVVPGKIDTDALARKVEARTRAIKLPPLWAFTFTMIVTNTLNKAVRQGKIGTKEAAYAEGMSIIDALKLKNADFLASIPV